MDHGRWDHAHLTGFFDQCQLLEQASKTHDELLDAHIQPLGRRPYQRKPALVRIVRFCLSGNLRHDHLRIYGWLPWWLFKWYHWLRQLVGLRFPFIWLKRLYVPGKLGIPRKRQSVPQDGIQVFFFKRRPLNTREEVRGSRSILVKQKGYDNH
jgi:hypothetical protein